ncbi:MAG TPA: transglutaminase family protein [Anaerolineae bacterium]|nr:transglutaminase family protein [Anaerolineae bacterium]
MRLQIEHTTTFTYDQPISEAYTEMRLKPLDMDGQRCLTFQLTTEPQDLVQQYADHFGNDVRHFDVVQPHQKLMVSAVSEVLTVDTYSADSSILSPLDAFNYLTPTDYAPHSPDLAGFSASHKIADSPLESAMALMHTIHENLVYEKGATDVTTTADKALSLGRGVCQDFSHIMLAVCRLQNIPARYVSGYLYNNGHTAASHAWVDVLVPGRGWVSLDPTHNTEQTEQYVRVAVGRDYADVPPTRGIFKGNAKEKMDVSVSIKVY